MMNKCWATLLGARKYYLHFALVNDIENLNNLIKYGFCKDKA